MCIYEIFGADYSPTSTALNPDLTMQQRDDITSLYSLRDITSRRVQTSRYYKPTCIVFTIESDSASP